MQATMIVHDWDKWQSYRSDRGAPPWIKIHRNLLTSTKWAYLSDAEKGQLISIWIIAADRNGVVPSCPKLLRKMCQLDEEPNINKFVKLGFIEQCCQQDDANVTPERRQSDVPEENRSEENRSEYDNDAAILIEACLLRKPGRKLNGRQLSEWSSQIEKMIRIDGRGRDEITQSLLWYRTHWNDSQFIPVIESGKALREKYDKLLNAINRGKPADGDNDGWK